MLCWIFLVRCSSRSTVIFLIVSKEIQKYDRRKFDFFSEKKHFQIWFIAETKIAKKIVNFFFLYTCMQNPRLRTSAQNNGPRTQKNGSWV